MPSPPLNILFLPRWYPNRYDPMSGLFIQRQAEALARKHRVLVLYVHPDPGSPNEFEIDYAEEEGVTVVRVYFNVPEQAIPGVYQVLYLVNYYRAHLRGLEVTAEFRPHIVHSHILTRTSVMGSLLSRRFRAPHVISEHWSRYFAENGSYRGWLRRWLTGYVVRRADALLPVSEVLKQAMRDWNLVNQRCFVVPNVIEFRVPARKRHVPSPLREFLHVSCFDDRSKNISGLVEAIAELTKSRTDFRCQMVGEGPGLEQVKALAAALGVLDKSVFFPGLKEPDELADLYSQADFTVLSSRFETFGAVIIESLACGTPVLSTRVGIAPEVITASNGLLVPANDMQALRRGLDRMLDQCLTFDRQAIQKSLSGRYTGEAVGHQLDLIYSTLLGDV